MAPKVWISKIEFSDNSNIQFERNDIVVFVGPNNSGKSATLKEVNKFIISRKGTGKVVKNIDMQKEGNEDDLVSFLKSNSGYNSYYKE